MSSEKQIMGMETVGSFCFWLHLVFVAVCRLSLVVVSGDYFRCGARAFHYGGFSLWNMGCRHAGFSSCGLVAPWHVGFSRTPTGKPRWSSEKQCACRIKFTFSARVSVIKVMG